MTRTAAEPRTIIVERAIAHPPEKIWRALTQPQLVADWLMAGDVGTDVGHRFSFGAEWGSVDCEIIAADPERMLSYSWVGKGLDSIVTWTLTPIAEGTLLRMEQTGFQPGQDQAYHGARAGWPRFFNALELLLARID